MPSRPTPDLHKPGAGYRPRRLRKRDLHLARGVGMRKMPLEVQDAVQERKKRIWDYHSMGGEAQKRHIKLTVLQHAGGLFLLGLPISILWLGGAVLAGMLLHLLLGAVLGLVVAWRHPGAYELGALTWGCGLAVFLITDNAGAFLPPLGPFVWLYYCCLGMAVGSSRLMGRFDGLWDPEARRQREVRRAQLYEREFSAPPVAVLPSHLRQSTQGTSESE